MKSPRLTSKATGAFTLVEILVSISVLGIMMVGVAQLMNSAISATLGGYRHLDADTQARMVLDRMAFDISKITKRTDVDYYLKNATTAATTMAGNDEMAFYSETGGYYPSSASTIQESDVSLVGYRINANSLELERLSKGLIWNGVTATSSNTDPPSPMVFLPQTILGTWPHIPTLSGSPGTDTDYQTIGDQIFRLEYCFLVENNTSGAAAAGAATTSATISDNPWYTPTDTSINGLQDVVAVVASIAVLDSQSRARISAAQLKTAIGDLPDDGGTAGTLPLTKWKAQLLSNGLGLPKTVASQVRFYQRYCYINHIQ